MKTQMNKLRGHEKHSGLDLSRQHIAISLSGQMTCQFYLRIGQAKATT